MSLREQNIGDRAIDTANFNALVRAVRKLLSTAYDPAFFSVRDTGSNLAITMRGGAVDGMNWSLFPFGAVESGADKVTISSGLFVMPGRLPAAVAVAETEVTVAGGTQLAPQWVYLEASKNNPADASIASTSIASEPNTADGSLFIIPICTVYLNGSSAMVLQRYQLSNIIVPSGAPL